MQKIVLLFTLIFSYYVSAQEIHTYGPLKKGESLWQVADKISPSPISRYQVIFALQALNPDAFRLSCNVNSLKINQVLRIPSLSQMQILSRQEASEEINRQNKAWKARYQQPIICPAAPDAAQAPAPAPVPVPVPPSIPLVSNTAANNDNDIDERLNKTPMFLTAYMNNKNPVYEEIHFQKISTSPSLMMISLLIIIGLLAAILIDWLLHKYIFKKTA